MKLAKEGRSIILYTLAAAVLVTAAMSYEIRLGMPGWVGGVIIAVFWALLLCVMLFFREPTRRRRQPDPDLVISSADGKVVVVEEVYEGEYLKCRCIQVSVFMSLTNVHANWYPVGGRVIYRNKHEGRFFVSDNEIHKSGKTERVSSSSENPLSETGGRSAYQTMVISSSMWPAPANLSMMNNT